MRFGRAQLLAVDAVVFIALCSDEKLVKGEQIATHLGLPRRYLEVMMQRLVRFGILDGTRGPLGGYRLARGADEITIAEVLRGVTDRMDADEDEPEWHTPLAREVIRPLWASLRFAVQESLERVTVATLRSRAEASAGSTLSERRPE
jgi:Rrf2 family transcriptional regulator, iron-sulfur cluster assembly transcription factor